MNHQSAPYWLMSAFIAICMLYAATAIATIKQPSDCERSALAAYITSQTAHTDIPNPWGREFIIFSRRLWITSRGDTATFLSRYIALCEQGRQPSFYRVVDGRVVSVGRA